MECVYAEATEEMPDARGLREMSREQRQQLFADPRAFSGKCIKMLCHYGYIPLPQWEGRYKVILMTRDPEDIMDSYRRFFGKEMVYRDGEDEIPFSAKLYDRILASTIHDASERGNIDFLILAGEYIVANPQKCFKTIAVHWPIDAEKAATAVDQSKRVSEVPAT
jgi:hypothetical protein